MNKLEGASVMVLGDSIMNGSGNHSFGVGEYLVQRRGMKLIKYCRGGTRVGYYEGKNWMVDQLHKAVENNDKPDYIVFDGFTNDCNKTNGKNADVPLGEVSEGFESFKDFDVFAISKENTTFSNCFEYTLATFKKYFPSSKVLFVRPHKMGRREADLQCIYGERALEICKKWGVAVADIYTDSGLDTFLPEHRDKYTFDSFNRGMGDCTHPNAICYEKFYMPLIEKKLEEL